MARLGDYIEQIRGVSYKPEDVCSSTDIDAVAILRANNIQDDELNFDDLVYVKKSKVHEKQYIQKGDIVVCASSGSKNLVGKAAVAKENMLISFGAFCKVVRPMGLFPKYIGHFFQSPKYRSTISELSGGANINNIRNEHIDELDIVLVSEEEQERIINELDAISSLIFLRKQQLAKLDELVKSRFIEMFGGIKDDEKVTLSDICLIITDGTHQPPKFTTTGIPFLFVSNIVGNTITYDAEKFISEETYAELIKRTPIEIGDVLLSTVGSYGHPAVVKSDKPFCFQRHIAYLKPSKELIDSQYLHGAMLSVDVQKQIEERVKGIAQKTLNLSEIRKIKLPLPTMDKQKQFAAFVQQIDKSKVEIQKSLNQLETLKKALMQKYFG